jgi:Peptidase_C39 like family
MPGLFLYSASWPGGCGYNPPMRRWLTWRGCLGLLLSGGLAVAGLALLYYVPPIHQRLYWRVAILRADVIRRVRPQPQLLPTPLPAETSLAANAPLATFTADASPTLIPTQTTAPVTGTPPPTETPLPTATPLPAAALISDVPHELQGWNNCGPATLSMALRFWGWQGDQLTAASWLKPNEQDKNVTPGEIEAYVNGQVRGMAAAYRVGGTLPALRTLLAAGYPVMVAKGLWYGDEGWIGHYLLAIGYDDEPQRLTFEDALHDTLTELSFDEFDQDWQSFNRTFVVVYPAARAGEVTSLLGGYAEPESSFQIALDTANAETQADPSNAFAWHNLGTNLVYFGDYQAASAAFDQARTLGLPWRLLWYQTSLYSAYYHTGRYQDVRVLANLTIDSTLGVPLEENLYWRGWAKIAQGDTRSGQRDFELALEFNPNFAPASQALADLEADPSATPPAVP